MKCHYYTLDNKLGKHYKLQRSLGISTLYPAVQLVHWMKLLAVKGLITEQVEQPFIERQLGLQLKLVVFQGAKV
jgi:hypothetical protein